MLKLYDKIMISYDKIMKIIQLILVNNFCRKGLDIGSRKVMGDKRKFQTWQIRQMMSFLKNLMRNYFY